MKVLAFSGSARKDSNTAMLTRVTLGELEQAGVQTEMIQLAGSKLQGCIACYKCWERKDRTCAVKDDEANNYIQKIRAAQGVILASPTYFADVTTEMKALMDRTGMVSRGNGNMFVRKVGAAIAVARRAGAIHAFDTMNHYFTIAEMIVVGSSYWNLGYGKDRGDVIKDEEAMSVMARLGQNMAWAMEKLFA